MDAINDLDFESYETSSIDLLGDAYEFLLAMYASNAGKSGGEFFTPQEVGELLARIIIMDKTSVNKVYDPACGSRVIIMAEVNNYYVNIRSSRLLPKFKTQKINSWCTV